MFNLHAFQSSRVPDFATFGSAKNFRASLISSLKDFRNRSGIGYPAKSVPVSGASLIWIHELGLVSCPYQKEKKKFS
jgi:hypothetical protein